MLPYRCCFNQSSAGENDGCGGGLGLVLTVLTQDLLGGYGHRGSVSYL